MLGPMVAKKHTVYAYEETDMKTQNCHAMRERWRYVRANCWKNSEKGATYSLRLIHYQGVIREGVPEEVISELSLGKGVTLFWQTRCECHV